MADALGSGAMLHSPTLNRLARPARMVRTIACALAVCSAPSLVGAQQPSGTPLPPEQVAKARSASQALWSDALHRPLATRQDLDSLASRLELEASASTDSVVANWKRQRAKLIRGRLADGDFRPGDRIFVSITGPQPFNDTVSVRTGDSVTVPGVVDVGLQGVLRAELEPKLAKSVGALFRGATVRAKSLVWVAVLGGVGKPGFYAVPADIVVGDALMRAGGPLPTANLDKVVVNREGLQLYSRDDIKAVFAQGITLDQLELRSGDQIVVGENKPKNIVSILQITAAILSLGFGLYGISRR